MIPRCGQGADDPDSVPQAAEGRGGRRPRQRADEGTARRRSAAENYEVEVSDRFERDVAEDASVGAYIALVDGERREARARRWRCAVRGARLSHAAVGAGRFASHRRPAVVGGLGEVDGYIYLGQQTPAFYAKQVVASLVDYGMSPAAAVLRRTDGLRRRKANIAFDCPGHQGGQFYRKSPAGQLFFKHFGESIFRNDLCNADVDLGDLLIHEGAAAEAQKHAAQVFGADRTYFVLNGTSTSNKVVTGAVLKRGDLVLFDRNNHKSLHQGALVQAGAIPIFLPTARNPFGMIGAVDWEAWDETYLREQIRSQPAGRPTSRAPTRQRPFRLACIQLAHLRRHDLQRAQGAREDRPPVRLRAVGRGLDRLQRLPPAVRRPQPDAAEGPRRRRCRGCSRPSRCTSRAPASRRPAQIHKRDEHIRGQKRYVEHKRFNESFLMHASTSPFYPLFASLDVNAKIHEGKAGEMLWDRCIELGIEARKKLREFGHHYAEHGTRCRRSSGSSTPSCPTS